VNLCGSLTITFLHFKADKIIGQPLTLTHTITAYSVSGNVVRVPILICATRQKPCRKGVYAKFHKLMQK